MAEDLIKEIVQAEHSSQGDPSGSEDRSEEPNEMLEEMQRHASMANEVRAYSIDDTDGVRKTSHVSYGRHDSSTFNSRTVSVDSTAIEHRNQ